MSEEQLRKEQVWQLAKQLAETVNAFIEASPLTYGEIRDATFIACNDLDITSISFGQVRPRRPLNSER